MKAGLFKIIKSYLKENLRSDCTDLNRREEDRKSVPRNMSSIKSTVVTGHHNTVVHLKLNRLLLYTGYV